MIKSLLYKVTSILPLSIARSIIGQHALLPYQHTVSNKPLPHIIEIYPYKNEQQFEKDLDVLLRYGNKYQLPNILSRFNQSGQCPKGSFILSFDDGFAEVYTTIAPLLVKKGINAIFFINPAFIDNKRLFYRNKISVLLSFIRNADAALLKDVALLLQCSESHEEIRKKLLTTADGTDEILSKLSDLFSFSESEYLQTHQPYLTTHQIQELSAKGFLFGGHSMDHPYYNRISLDNQIAQTVASVEWVHSTIKQELKLFSFPHSDAHAHKEFFNQLQLQANKPDILFGTQNMQTEMHTKVLHRFNAERPQYDLESLIKTLSIYLMAKRALGKSQVKRP